MASWASVQAGPVVQVGQVGEHHRDLAQLGQPLHVAGDHRGQHRPGQVRGDQLGRRPSPPADRRGRRRGAGCRPGRGPAAPGPGGEHHHSGPGPLGRGGRLRHRRPGDQQLRRSRSPPTSSTTTSPAPMPMRRARRSRWPRHSGPAPPAWPRRSRPPRPWPRPGPPVAPSARQQASSASPANLSTSPPVPAISSSSGPNAPSSSPRSSSAPPGPRLASRSAVAVNPEMSASSRPRPAGRRTAGRRSPAPRPAAAPAGPAGSWPTPHCQRPAISSPPAGDLLPRPCASQDMGAGPVRGLGWSTTSKAWRKGAWTP